MENYDIVIIGGGPAGLSAALAAVKSGCSSVIILEREQVLGGILNQCIHNGFGLHTFQEELTGPEYAKRFIDQIKANNVCYKISTMVIDIREDRIITALGEKEGLIQIQAKAVILAMGCRERPRGALNIPGYRPSGIYTAGTAQKLVNIDGKLPGKEVVILGSGDIGLIMARRMTLEGAKVKLVAEIMPYSGGLKRNIVQCLDDFDIPLKLSHTVIDIKGKERVEGVTVAKVDENLKPILDTKEYIPCDTLLLSVGLIPENELSLNIGIHLNQATSGPFVHENLETNCRGVFACGNVLHVHDLVDYVSEEADSAGKSAARYILEEKERKFVEDNEASSIIKLEAGQGIRYTVPNTINIKRMKETIIIRFRANQVYNNCSIGINFDNVRVKQNKKRILAPGEMEEVKIEKSELERFPNMKKIEIYIDQQ